MSAELAKLLIRGGVPAVEVEGLLASMVSRQTNLPSALAAERPELLEVLERELVRADVPSLELVRPLPELVAALPEGLCARLGALPVHQDARSGRIDVAVLDPLDSHVARELEYHLDAPVRVLWARFEVFDGALQQSFGGRPQNPSGPPLPLVQRVGTSGANQGGIEGVQGSDDDEPVLSLARSKARTVTPMPPPAALELRAEAPKLEDSLAELEKAQNPDDVVMALVQSLKPAPALVLAVRGQAYEGRAGSASLAAKGVRRVRIAVGVPSVAETALRHGYYLGTLPLTSTHDAIREVLGSAADAEMYVTQVCISSRPSLVVLVALTRELGGSVEATRRVDQLCRAAGHALESIVVSKKRGGVA